MTQAILKSRGKERMTVADYLALDDDRRYELVEGELFMAPSPEFFHQQVVLTLAEWLKRYVKGKGIVTMAPLDTVFSDYTVLQPDVLFIKKEHRSIIKDRIYGVPDVVVEVLSPHSIKRDRLIKKGQYSRYHVPEYWIVDYENKGIEVYTLKNRRLKLYDIFGEGDRLNTPTFPHMNLPVKRVFVLPELFP